MTAADLVLRELAGAEDAARRATEVCERLFELFPELEDASDDFLHFQVLTATAEGLMTRAARSPELRAKLERLRRLARFFLQSQAAEPGLFAHALQKAQRMVGFIRNDQGKNVGTGFLIGAKHLVTADHVVDAHNVAVEFMDGAPANLVRVVARNASMDYAVYELNREAGVDLDPSCAKRSWVPLPNSLPPAVDGDTVLILHWPSALLLSIGTRSVSSAAPTEIRYSVATVPGSSGAGCFDIYWNCIGLHLSDYGMGRAADAIRQDVLAQGVILYPPPVTLYPAPPMGPLIDI